MTNFADFSRPTANANCSKTGSPIKKKMSLEPRETFLQAHWNEHTFRTRISELGPIARATGKGLPVQSAPYLFLLFL